MNNDHLFYYMKNGHLTANPILDRVQVLSILNVEQRLGEIAEIGVFEGEYTEQILQNWNGQRVTGVDPYFNFTFEEYRDGCNRANMEATMIKMLKRTAPFGDRFNLIRQKSVEAAQQFPDETFDFVYIDANHSYDSVCADIKAWWPKVRKTGLFGGHDYYMRDDPAQLCQVQQAVDEFIQEQGLKFATTPDTSWWTRKKTR